MNDHIFPAIKLTFICMLWFAGFYPLLVWGVAQLAPNNGKGNIILHKGSYHYSNVGQKFTDDKYFWSRPSAVDYNAAGAGGSNKGPSNPDYLAQVQARIDTFLAHNPGVVKADIPSELVTASGGGLDPHISVQAAEIQAPRIAKIWNLPEPDIRALIARHTNAPMLGLFGTETINVLQLNISLDQLNKQ